MGWFKKTQTEKLVYFINKYNNKHNDLKLYYSRLNTWFPERVCVHIDKPGNYQSYEEITAFFDITKIKITDVMMASLICQLRMHYAWFQHNDYKNMSRSFKFVY